MIDIDPAKLALLGTPFVVKPSKTTGGGTGVVLNAATIDDIRSARITHKEDQYLVQETIHPKMFGERRGWFRAYSVFDEIILTWWDDRTHRHDELSSGEEGQFHLSELRSVMKTIRNVCRLDFFSSEIAVTDDGTSVVIDYVNEICDMRLKSIYEDGVPDSIIHRIQQLIADAAGEYLRSHETGD